jgi:glycosyltransferase involved in cell wall biosynthesis
VDDGVTGYLVPPGDSGALAEKITELLNNPERALTFAKNARTKVESTFTIEKMIHDYEGLYERVAGRA